MIDASCLFPVSLLLLRIIVAIVFFSSGKSHAANPVERGKRVTAETMIAEQLPIRVLPEKP